jgi:ribosomal protein L17
VRNHEPFADESFMVSCRNLVTSLFEHEQIKTTLPKARDTARLAEKVVLDGVLTGSVYSLFTDYHARQAGR